MYGEKRNVRRGIIAVLLIVLVSGLLAAQASGPPIARSTARVEYLEGGVRIDGEAAELGQRVSFGALIQTAADGYVEVGFEEGNILRIDPDSVVRLSLGRRIRRVQLRSGQLAAVAEGLRRDSDERRLILETPSTVAGVRGTLFFARVESADSTYICTCYGELEMEGPGFDPFRVRSGHHAARRFTREANGSVGVTEAPLLYHDDDDMNDLAAKVGVIVEWGDYSGYGNDSSGSY